MWPFEKEPTIEMLVFDLADELYRGYSPKDGCTQPQLTKTFADLCYDPVLWEIFCCLFLANDDLENEKKKKPTNNWEESRVEALRLSRQLNTFRSTSSDSAFHESGAGQSGA